MYARPAVAVGPVARLARRGGDLVRPVSRLGGIVCFHPVPRGLPWPVWVVMDEPGAVDVGMEDGALVDILWPQGSCHFPGGCLCGALLGAGWMDGHNWNFVMGWKPQAGVSSLISGGDGGREGGTGERVWI